MYYIRKYSDCWAIHNDDNGKSRPLTPEEKAIIIEAYPRILLPNLLTIFQDDFPEIKRKP